MLVQINTDNRIEGSKGMNVAMESRLREQLARFADRLTRAELHLRDVDGDRNGPQAIEATLELRPAGGQPVSMRPCRPRFAKRWTCSTAASASRTRFADRRRGAGSGCSARRRDRSTAGPPRSRTSP